MEVSEVSETPRIIPNTESGPSPRETQAREAGDTGGTNQLLMAWTFQGFPCFRSDHEKHWLVHSEKKTDPLLPGPSCLCVLSGDP